MITSRLQVLELASASENEVHRSWRNCLGDHSRRVTKYAQRLAAAVRLPQAAAAELGTAGVLHDVGKMALPIALLTKPGRLSETEWCAMKTHPTIGAFMAGRLGCSLSICGIIESHHEHYDGTGYPGRKAAEDIPLGARILTIADVFDALTSARSYRPALSITAAIATMRREVATVLDPQLFQVFTGLVRQEDLSQENGLRMIAC